MASGSGSRAEGDSLDLELDSYDCDFKHEDDTCSRFDLIIGAIEDIIMMTDFKDIQNRFLDTYYSEFGKRDDGDCVVGEGDGDGDVGGEQEKDDLNSSFSHKQFAIFQDYSRSLGLLLETELKQRFDQEDGQEFDIEHDLYSELTGPRKSDLDGEIFEILFTLIDFVKFHELFVDHRLFVEGKTAHLMGDTSGNIAGTSSGGDGELDFGAGILTVKSIQVHEDLDSD